MWNAFLVCSLSHLRRSIIGSLAGTSYYGPVAGHGFLSHDLELIRQQRRELLPERERMVKGPIEAVPQKTYGEPGFIVIKKHEAQPEGGKEAASEQQD